MSGARGTRSESNLYETRPSGFDHAYRELDATVSGLLTLSVCGFSSAHTGRDRTQSNLDEALEIAGRGPMKLHMADILLTRAGLSGARSEDAKHPWASLVANLAAAFSRGVRKGNPMLRRTDSLSPASVFGWATTGQPAWTGAPWGGGAPNFTPR